MSKQRRLGKGIDALLQGRDIESLESGDVNSVVSVPLDRIRPNPEQPRKSFTTESLEELARSIEERGIIQPIIAEQQSDGTYTIIAGERRFRAAGIAGLTVVPVLPGVFSAEEKLEIALIENVQRQDLSPIEEARAYRDLMDRGGLNQEELAHRIGKSRPAVANSLRLLRLPEEIQELTDSGVLSAGHARTLLGLEDHALIPDIVRLLEDEPLSVRAVERLVATVNDGRSLDEAYSVLFSDETQNSERPESEPRQQDNAPTTPSPPNQSVAPGARKTVEMQQIEQQLIERLGTRVVVTGSNDRGKIEISYLSMEDLDRIVEILVPDAVRID